MLLINQVVKFEDRADWSGEENRYWQDQRPSRQSFCLIGAHSPSIIENCAKRRFAFFLLLISVAAHNSQLTRLKIGTPAPLSDDGSRTDYPPQLSINEVR